MKLTKSLYFILIIVLLVGCKTKQRPNDLSDDNYNAAKEIIVVIDNYLDSKISIKDAYNALNRLDGYFSSDAARDSTEKELYYLSTNLKYTFLNGTYDGYVDFEEIKEFKTNILNCIEE